MRNGAARPPGPLSLDEPGVDKPLQPEADRFERRRHRVAVPGHGVEPIQKCLRRAERPRSESGH